MDKKQLYNLIMEKVSIQVMKALNESETTDDLRDAINAYVNNTEYFNAKEDGKYIRILLFNNYEIADFNLDKDSAIRTAPRYSYIPTSNGDYKNTFRVCNVATSQYDDSGRGFLKIYANEEKFLECLSTTSKCMRYYTLKALYENPTLKEANNWNCAQWGTWKIIINSVEDIKACIDALCSAYEHIMN